MWEPSCSSTSSPRFVLTWSPTWFVIVPEGAYSAASLPSRSATYSSSRFTVGSSPNTSSPTDASSIARRMPSVGRVTVSLRRSIKARLHPPPRGGKVDLRPLRQTVFPEFPDHPPTGLHNVRRSEWQTEAYLLRESVDLLELPRPRHYRRSSHSRVVLSPRTHLE